MDKGASLRDRAATASQPSQQAVSGIADIPSAKVLIFADDPDRKPRLYACAKCGSLHSPEIYLATEERKHQAAREAAENCYNCLTHSECKTCGCETPKGWGECTSCRTTRKLEAAEEIPDNGGPYCAFDGDTYYQELDEAADDGLEWVSPCLIEYPRLDGDSILDGILSDMHDDADIDDLHGVDEFLAAARAFNEAQTAQTWWPDNKRKIRVPAQAIEARSGKTGTGLTEGESAVAESHAPETPQGDHP